ncbi:hypothetical protein N9988_00560 [bacterium]|nr:hypothetical protein [bacterium]
MKLFLADSTKYGIDLFCKAGIKNVLLSYYYFYTPSYFEHLKENYENVRIFLDSGAFSAFTLNNPIVPETYYQFVKDNPNLFDIVASLDDIKDPETTKQNFKELKKIREDVVPAFHYGEDLDYLKYYCKNADYIALGGTAHIRDTRKISNWFSQCFEIIPKGKKVHAFGVFAESLILRYAKVLESADASTFSSKQAGMNNSMGISGFQKKTKGFKGQERISRNQIEKLILYNCKRVLTTEEQTSEYGRI